MRRTSVILVVAFSATLFTQSVTGTARAAGTAVQPQRVLDTRAGLGSGPGPLGPGRTLVLPVAAAAAAGAKSVTINLTATDAGGPGFLTAWPCGQPMPATSVLNFVPGQTVANLVAVGIGTNGVCLASSAPVQVVADLMGWFTGSDDFRGAAPSRLLDTRVTHDPLTANGERHLSLSAGTGFTASAAGVALNVTVVAPKADGFLVVYPCGPRPLASTVNFRAGEITPNFTIVPFSSAQVCLYSSVDTDVVVDSFGWTNSGSGLQLASPSRLLDTRIKFGWASGAVTPSTSVQLRVPGRGSVPNNASAVLLTVTATGGTADGFVTAWPCDQPRPVTSVLNLRAGLLRSNLTFVPLSQTDGSVCLYAYTVNGSPVDLVADAVGWIPNGPARTPPPPEPQPPTGGNHFGTLPVGTALPSDATCASEVRPAAETRPANQQYNNTKGPGAPSNPPSPYYSRVTGNFTGTTDQIIQWAACKWGIDEDIVRAQVVKESYWFQRTVSDFDSDASACAPGHPIGTDGHVGECPQSVGLMQVRYPYNVTAFPGVENSTAYNLDWALAARRECFEGYDTWLNTVDRGQQYAAGDLWGCIGMWFSGRWYTQPAKDYIAAVQQELANRTWESSSFLSAT